MHHIASIFTLCVLVGCTSPPPQPVGDTARVDPRLLERTDQRASSFAEERAKEHHKTTIYAEWYRVLQRSWVLAHGGYSVKFGTRSNSTEGVTYYFDERNQVMRTERRFPPY